MRPLVILLLGTCLAVPTAHAQDSTHTPPWSFDASLWAYIVPDSPDYLSPTVTADHRWLHLEGRYNYEALETASFWAGYNLRAGGKLSLQLTPMVGAVVGKLNGMAPGYELTLDWWKLELFSEGEYVFDFDDVSEDFFYNWSQLGIAPVEWLQLGVALQRTRAYQTNRDVQRGFFAGATYKWLNPAVFLFNPDDSPTVVLSVGASF